MCKNEEKRKRTCTWLLSSINVRSGRNNQELEILKYARKHNINVDDFISLEVSSRKDTKTRRIDELMERLKIGDTLIVSELSRLGRSVGQLATMVDTFINNKIKFIAIKENINLNGNVEKTFRPRH